jgi:hypothetical protein
MLGWFDMQRLIVLFGPPASGKAAVGLELAGQTGYRFFHNHLTADPVAALFGWGTPTFGAVLKEVRDVLFRHALADASIPGIVFTLVWALDRPEQTASVEDLIGLFESHGWAVDLVELLASLDTRIAREGTPLRTRLKPNLGEVEAARQRQRDAAKTYRMNSGGTLPIARRHVIIDTETCEPAQAAAEILRRLGL